MSTSILLARVSLKPRALIAYCAASTRATLRLGASRSASPSDVAPARRMSRAEMTKIELDTAPSDVTVSQPVAFVPQSVYEPDTGGLSPAAAGPLPDSLCAAAGMPFR